MIRDFKNDIKTKGRPAELIFIQDFLLFFNIKYLDVSQQYKGYDFITDLFGKIDIKPYNDNGYISLETWSIFEKTIKGWIDTSTANWFVFISIKTRTMLFLRNDLKFKQWWLSNKDRFFEREQHSSNNGQIWTSKHRNVPIQELVASFYRKKDVQKKYQMPAF